MRILTRYILKEVTAHALIGVAVFTFVVFMRDMGRILELVVRQSAPLSSVAQIFIFTLPVALTVTLPMGVLVGILIGLGRLSADSEVTAMRAAGMGVMTFVRVIALFALAAWLLAVANSTWAAPRAAAALGELQNRLRTRQASFEIQPRVFYEDLPNYVLYVQDSSAANGVARWEGVFLADVSMPGAPRTILAEEALVIHEGAQRLRLRLRNGTQHESGARRPEQYTISTFQETDIPIQLPEPPQLRQAGELTPAAQLTTTELWRRAHRPPQESEPDARGPQWYRIEFHRRLALPAASLVLALIGIPLGLTSKKGGKSAGFTLTILLVFIYYVISLTGVSLARQGEWPPGPAVWTANFVFLVAGLLLLWRVDRMPLETGAVRAFAADMKARLGRWARRRPAQGEGDAFQRAVSRRRMFSARFPQILDDYILRDFGLYLGLILGSFVVLVLVFNFFELLNDIVRQDTPAVIVAEYLLMVIPTMLYLLTPLIVLLAVLVTLGMLQRSNEVTAMKATGISVYRITTPLLVMAAVLASALFFFDQLYLPYANRRHEALRNQIKGKPAQTWLRPDRKWIFGQHSTIYYYEFFDFDRQQFANISAFQFDPRTFEVERRVYATRAHWNDDLGKWVFEQGWTRSFRGAAIEEHREFDVATFEGLNEHPSYFRKEVRQSQEMSYLELRQYVADLQQSGFEVIRLRVQLHKKLAYPVVTFVMAVLAIPFALSMGRRGALAGVGVAIGIAVVYWAVSGLFEAMGNVGQLPPALAAWAPSLIFGASGGYLVLKVPT